MVLKNKFQLRDCHGEVDIFFREKCRSTRLYHKMCRAKITFQPRRKCDRKSGIYFTRF